MIQALLTRKIATYAAIALVVLVGLMSWLYLSEKSSHARTIKEYAKFQAETKALGEQQIAENKRMVATWMKSVTQMQEQFDQTLQDKLAIPIGEAKKYRRKYQDAINSNNTLRAAIELRNNTNTGGGRTTEIPINTGPLAKAERDCDGTISTLIEAGVSCYLDYKELYESYEKSCNIFGCE